MAGECFKKKKKEEVRRSKGKALSSSLGDFQNLLNTADPLTRSSGAISPSTVSQGNGVEQLVVIGRKLLLAGLLEATLNLRLADEAGFGEVHFGCLI